MIELKPKINKSAELRGLRSEAKKEYANSSNSKLKVAAFMEGAYRTMNALRLDSANTPVCQCVADDDLSDEIKNNKCNVCERPIY